MIYSKASSSGLFLTRRGLLLSCAALAGAMRARGYQSEQAAQQSPGQQPTFSTNVKVVNVFATVRDKDGQVVRNLTKDDFTLEEDGMPQTIQYFSQQSDLPLTLGLLVDTSGSERRMLGTERDASRTFLEQVLRPEKDKAFLIHFDREVELLQDLTSSRQKLEKALDLIDQPQWGGNRGGGSAGGNGAGNDPNDPGNYPGGSGQGGNNGGWGGNGSGGGWRGGQRGGGGGRQSRQGGHGGGGTALYDAIYLASNDVLEKQRGRKAIILLTDGEDTGSKLSMAESITSAQRADALAYSVRIADDESAFNRGFGGPGMGGRHGGGRGGGGGGMGRPSAQSRPDGKKVLRQISQETGGGYFEVSKKKTVHEIYKEIEDELRSQYSIGYTPKQSSGGNQFRTIRLTVKQKGLVVQSRSGYYPADGAE